MGNVYMPKWQKEISSFMGIKSGFIIEGDVYFMQFGSGNFYTKVGFYATETGWEETAYGYDEVAHSNL